MLNSRIVLSVIAFFAGLMLVVALVTLGVIDPLGFVALSFAFKIYFIAVYTGYVYFWFFFFRRRRGSKTVVDGRTALSVCGLIVGGCSGYVLVDTGFIAPTRFSPETTSGSLFLIVATILPFLIWFAVFAHSRRRMKAAR